MTDQNVLTLQQADQARTDVGHSHLLLTRGQRLKLRLFLGFAKVLRWCRLISQISTSSHCGQTRTDFAMIEIDLQFLMGQLARVLAWAPAAAGRG